MTTILFTVFILGKPPKKGGRSINFRCFKDIDNDVFKEDLVNAPWDRVLSCHDEAWSLWHSLFMSIINHHAPMKSKRIQGDSLPWRDGKILQLMRQRDCAHKIAKRSGSQHDWDAYKKLQNTVTKKIRTTKSEYFTSTIEDNKSNSFFAVEKTKKGASLQKENYS